MADKSMIVNRLQQMVTAKDRMEQKQAQLAELNNQINALAAAGGNRGDKRKLQAIAKKQLSTAVDKYAKAYSEGNAMIDSICIKHKDGTIDSKDTELCKTIMERRYLQCQSWERIACEIHYSWRQVMRLHAKAIKILAKTYN